MPPPLVEQERFPAAVHFRARLWVQWGQGVEPDTWQELGAGDGRAVPKGQLQAGGLLRQLQPCSLHSPAEGQGSSPGATRFAPQGRRRLRCRQQGLPRQAQPQAQREDEGSPPWQSGPLQELRPAFWPPSGHYWWVKSTHTHQLP